MTTKYHENKQHKNYRPTDTDNIMAFSSLLRVMKITYRIQNKTKISNLVHTTRF